MLFLLSKVISYFLNPLFWVFLLLIFSLFLKNKALKRKMLIVSIIVLYFFSNNFIYSNIEDLFTPNIVKAEDLKQNYEYGIVMGGFSSYDSKNNKIVFREASDRLLQTVDLYFNRKIKKIIISGGSAKIFVDQRKEADFIKEYLINIGIPETDIIAENKSKNTHENALFSSKLLPDKSITVLLITSSTHIYRTKKCYEKEGLVTDIYPTDYRIKEKYTIGNIIIPDSTVFVKWTKLIHEIIGIISYKVLGYI